MTSVITRDMGNHHDNPQEDLDNDGLGDECDSDIDEDLSINEKDWCPYDPDIASDKGNKADKDNDGWLNDCDNCPSEFYIACRTFADISGHQNELNFGK